MTEFKNGSSHAEFLTGGATIEPGGTIELDDDAQADAHNAALINRGQLIPTGGGDEPKSKTKATKESSSEEGGSE
jgi:hypothetical protein